MPVEMPRTKQVLQPARTRDGVIHTGNNVYGIASEIPDPSGLVWEILALADGTRTCSEIAAALPAGSGCSTADVVDALEALLDAGIVEDAALDSLHSLTSEEVERYGRSVSFFAATDAGPSRPRHDYQERLRSSSVCVVGLGGIGSTVATSLTAMGVGSIRLVDFDVVELSNLNRQTSYTTADVGTPKIDALAARLRALNPHVAVHTVDHRVASADDVVELIEGCDVLVLGADRPAGLIDFWGDEASFRTGIPWITTMYSGAKTELGVYVPGAGCCFSCARGSIDVDPRYLDMDSLQESPHDPFIQPVIAPTAAIASQYAALETVYLLVGLGSRMAGCIYRQSLIHFQDQMLHRGISAPACERCGRDGWHPAPTWMAEPLPDAA